MKVIPPLDKDFLPIEMACREYASAVSKCPDRIRVCVNVERNLGYCDYFEMEIFPENEQWAWTEAITDRYLKSMLWCRGGWRITIYGSKKLYAAIQRNYAPEGSRAFDADFMTTVYEKPFEVRYTENLSDAKKRRNGEKSVGKHLSGCRIGFDAGGSDRKASAVVEGQSVFSEEIVWSPKTQTDPEYHFQGILEGMKAAASHLPRVDAIGVSTAGVCVDNKIMVASLFMKVDKTKHKARMNNIYLDAAREIGPDIPLEVANDGDVTALAGSMELGCGNVLGIAMGTSEAGGYVNKDMQLMGWLNELAFVPVDLNRGAAVDEWSGDYGCGVKYFSQDGAIRLAEAAGIALEESLTPGEKLKEIQRCFREGNREAAAIYQTIGAYLGYTLAWYRRFYEIDHVLLLGRVTSGEGGPIIKEWAEKVLREEFDGPGEEIRLHLPDEHSRRVGQSIAAASLAEA